jgi:hypothetical protein
MSVEGSRCGEGTCHSSTIVPALVYFPAGTVSALTPSLHDLDPRITVPCLVSNHPILLHGNVCSFFRVQREVSLTVPCRVGDAKNRPILKAAPGFAGIAVIGMTICVGISI